MTDRRPRPAPAAAPQKDHGRAGRDLKAAVGSAVVLLGAIAASLAFWKPAFMVIVVVAVVVAIWELRQGLLAKDIDLPEQPLMLGGAVMVVVAYVWGTDALVTATAVTALVVMLWLLRRGIDGYVKTATASVFTLVYVPFLGSFVALMLAEGGRRRRRARRRRRPGHPRLHPGHHRLRHRRLHRRRAVRQAPDGPGHLAQEVVGGLRRLAGRLRRRSAWLLVVLPARRRLVGRARASA